MQESDGGPRKRRRLDNNGIGERDGPVEVACTAYFRSGAHDDLGNLPYNTSVDVMGQRMFAGAACYFCVASCRFRWSSLQRHCQALSAPHPAVLVQLGARVFQALLPIWRAS